MSRNYSNCNFKRERLIPLTVLVDMDCVLCDFEGHFLRCYKETYPEEPYVPLEERNSFYVGDQYKTIRPDLPEKVNSVIYSPGFFRDIPPIKGGIPAVKEMSGLQNVEVFLCTSPPYTYTHAAVEKFQWVEQHLGKDWINRLILTRDKTIIGGDLLIDDKPRIKGAVPCPSWKHVLYTAAHNVRLDPLKVGAIARLDSWADSSVWKKMLEDRRKEIL